MNGPEKLREADLGRGQYQLELLIADHLFMVSSPKLWGGIFSSSYIF